LGLAKIHIFRETRAASFLHLRRRRRRRRRRFAFRGKIWQEMVDLT